MTSTLDVRDGDSLRNIGYYYSKPSLIRINWGGHPDYAIIRISVAKEIALKTKNIENK
jgi:hypothetical protein